MLVAEGTTLILSAAGLDVPSVTDTGNSSAAKNERGKRLALGMGRRGSEPGLCCSLDRELGQALLSLPDP